MAGGATERRLGIVSVYGGDISWIPTVGNPGSVQFTADGSQLWVTSEVAVPLEESELPAKWNIYKDINALVSGTKKASDIDAASWPDHLKSQVASAATWPNITEQKKPLPGADEAAKEENKLSALTLEGP